MPLAAAAERYTVMDQRRAIKVLLTVLIEARPRAIRWWHCPRIAQGPALRSALRPTGGRRRWAEDAGPADHHQRAGVRPRQSGVRSADGDRHRACGAQRPGVGHHPGPRDASAAGARHRPGGLLPRGAGDPRRGPGGRRGGARLRPQLARHRSARVADRIRPSGRGQAPAAVPCSGCANSTSSPSGPQTYTSR